MFSPFSKSNFIFLFTYANAFNLDGSKMLKFGKELNKTYDV